MNNDNNLLGSIRVMDAANLMLMKYDRDRQVKQLQRNTDIERYIATEFYNGTN